MFIGWICTHIYLYIKHTLLYRITINAISALHSRIWMCVFLLAISSFMYNDWRMIRSITWLNPWIKPNLPPAVSSPGQMNNCGVEGGVDFILLTIIVFFINLLWNILRCWNINEIMNQSKCKFVLISELWTYFCDVRNRQFPPPTLKQLLIWPGLLTMDNNGLIFNYIYTYIYIHTYFYINTYICISCHFISILNCYMYLTICMHTYFYMFVFISYVFIYDCSLCTCRYCLFTL